MGVMDIRKKRIEVRLAITLGAIAIAYLVLVHILTPLFVHEPGNPLHDLFPQEPEAVIFSITIVSILLSVSAGLVVASYLELFRGNALPLARNKKVEADLDVLKKMMSKDEKDVVDEVVKAGEITQDSLRLRLDWSKAKLSTVISVLDRQGVLQRERSGKTYRVRLDPSIKTVQNRSDGN